MQSARTIGRQHKKTVLMMQQTAPQEKTALSCPRSMVRSGHSASPICIWQRWAGNVCGKSIRGGHLQPEESPEDVLAELLPFLLSTEPDERN